MLNLTVIASSGESVAAASCVRRKVFSTSSRVIDRPSTVAHVSAETGFGLPPQPTTAPISISTHSEESTRFILSIILHESIL